MSMSDVFKKMNCIQEKFLLNNCRLCRKTFCCGECRVRHEEDYHKVYADCDVCIYGRIYFSKASEKVLNHIEKTHFPLHCTYCKLNFQKMSEIIEHHKCSAKLTPVTSKTPVRPLPIFNVIQPEYNQDSNFDSPPVGLNNHLHLIPSTSTPMQGLMPETFPDTITPVESNEYKAKIEFKNTLLTPSCDEEPKKIFTTLKRRVTFSETPYPEHQDNKSKIRKEEAVAVMCREEVIYRNSDDEDPCVCKKNVKSERRTIKVKKRRSSLMSETLWQSAINDSVSIEDECYNTYNQVATIYISEVNTRVRQYSRHPNELCTYQNNIPSIGSIWTSMTSMVKNVVNGFSKKPVEAITSKRHLSDSDHTDLEMRKLKRLKLTELKCRPPIRNGGRMNYVRKFDKATQTDEVFIQG